LLAATNVSLSQIRALGVRVALKPVQPRLHGLRINLFQRQTEVVDSGNER
jgi:hypothetical protein